jgi:hypothetical protein
VLSVGFSYATVSFAELAQVEDLVGLPIMATIVLALRVMERGAGRRRLDAVGAGVALFVVASFKLMLVLVPLAAVATVAVLRRRDAARLGSVRDAVEAAAGFVVPSALLVGWMWRRGALGELLLTWFEVPLGVPERAGRSTATLVQSVSTFGKVYAPVLVLAAVGALRARPRGRDPLAQSMVAWVVAGAVAFVLQLWWYYLLVVLVVPLGVLAAYGADTLWCYRRRVPRVAFVVAAVLLVASGGYAGERFARRAKHLVESNFAIGAAHAREFRFAESPHYRDVHEHARILRALPPGDEVVVWSDPLYLYLGERPNAIAVNGWAPEHLDQRLWNRAARELAAARPHLVFVDDFSARYIRSRGRGVAQVLARDFDRLRSTADGVWYRRRPGR